MTSLAHQLKRLALPQSDPALLSRREVASLLFDPKDAATIDRSTFYALGEFWPSIKACFHDTQLTPVLAVPPNFRLHRAGGAAGNRDSLSGVPGHPVQLSVSDDGAQCSVQRSQRETRHRHLTLPHPPLPLPSPQTGTQVP